MAPLSSIDCLTLFSSRVPMLCELTKKLSKILVINGFIGPLVVLNRDSRPGLR